MSKRRYWTGAKKVPAQDKFFIGALDPDLWAAGDENQWDACWHTGMPARGVFRTMRPGQWVNHIPGNHALTVKSQLYQALDAARRRAPTELHERFSFFPRSYLMPEDYHALQRDAFEAPDRRWIIKPKSLSRGRGISVAADAGIVPVDAKMMVQEYLKHPHLYDGRKYVLRCYLAIMSVEPLRVYLYKEGFVKLASEPYQDGDFDNLYAHLTNPDVNALNDEVDDSVVFHSFADYRRWLARNGGDPGPLFEALREIGVIAAIAARDIMRARLAASGAWAPGCCELIGMDCMIDENLKPWLLECNLSPSLGVCAAPETGGVMEEEIKRAVVADFVAMAGLNESNPPQPDPEDLSSLIRASEREGERAGGYERIFPAADAGDFFPFFPAPRFADIALAQTVAPGAGDDCAFAANKISEFAFDDDIVLCRDGLHKPMAPSVAGAYIWLRAGDGATPDDIARDLAQFAGATDVSKTTTLKTVWDTLADWGAAGLIRPAGMTPPPQAAAKTVRQRRFVAKHTIGFAGGAYRIEWATPEIAPRLEALLAPIETDHAHDDDATEISILADRAGYAFAIGPQLHRTNVRLSAVVGALIDVLEKDAAARTDAPLLAGSLWRIGDRTALMASSARTRWDGVGAALAAAGDAQLIAGAATLNNPPCSVRALPAPARVKTEDAPRPSILISQWAHEDRGAFIPLTVAPDDVYSIDAVIFPTFHAAVEDASTTLLEGRRAFLALAELCNSLSQAAAARLAEWPGAAPLIALSFSDCSDGARAVIAAVSNDIVTKGTITSAK